MKTLLKITLLIVISISLTNTSNAQLNRLKNAASKEIGGIGKKEEPAKQETKAAEKKEEPAKAVATPNGKDIYVSPSGSNRNQGTIDAPLKNLDKAIERADAHDKIHVTEGVYSGTFEVGFFEITKPLEIYGSYNADFSRRDPATTPSIIRTKPKSGSGKQTIFYIRETNNVVIDGLTIDMSEQNNYDKNAPAGLETGYLTLTNTGGTPQRSAIRIVGNNVTIRNNTFVNISYGGVSIAQRMNMEGKIHIDNNLFVNCAHTGIDCGVLTSPRQETKEIEISNNTFAFTYGTTFVNNNLGCAIWLKPNAKFNIHNNIFSYASDAAIRFLDYNGATLDLNHNYFINNRQNDIHTSIHNKRVFITVEQFEDVDFVQSLEGNKRMAHKLPLNQAYLNEFFNMAAEVAMEYDPDSDWNQVRSILGLPQQASGTAKISFFANKYPTEEAYKLFGAVNGVGAQKIK
jgi:hypothetical protein